MHPAVRRVFEGAKDALLSEEDRAEIIRRQNGLCLDCQQPLGAAIIYGHVVPRNQGGVHRIENRVALCPPCEAKRVKR